eukprot:UN11546
MNSGTNNDTIYTQYKPQPNQETFLPLCLPKEVEFWVIGGSKIPVDTRKSCIFYNFDKCQWINGPLLKETSFNPVVQSIDNKHNVMVIISSNDPHSGKICDTFHYQLLDRRTKSIQSFATNASQNFRYWLYVPPNIDALHSFPDRVAL